MSSSAPEFTGSCLCGGVRYRARGPLTAVARCFCSECRKQSGSEFALNAEPLPGSFALECGQDLVREFESSTGQWRVFCGRCGSPLYKRYDADPDRIRLRLGLVDQPIDARPAVQVFAAERMVATRIDPSIPTYVRAPGSARLTDSES